MAAGATLYPNVPRALSTVGEDFYLHGPETEVQRQITIQVVGPDGNLRNTWLARYMEEKINGLLCLRAGWDGYRARPVSYEAVTAGLNLLFGVAGDLSLPPQVFPLVDGGLQMEWHADQSVEIEVDGRGEAHVLTTDEAGTVVINEELALGDHAALARVRRALRQLSAHLAGAR